MPKPVMTIAGLPFRGRLHHYSGVRTSFLRRVSTKIRENRNKLTLYEAASLQVAINDSLRLSSMLNQSHRKHPLGSKLAKPKATPRYKPEKGIYINGVRCCKLCKRPIPHIGKEANRFHMLAAKRRWMQKAAREHFLKVGYAKFAHSGYPVRQRQALARRMAIFKELAPLAAAKFTDAEIEEIVKKSRTPDKRTISGLQFASIDRYRRWVLRNYR